MHAGLFDGAERAELALDPKRLALRARGARQRARQRPALAAGDAARLDGESRLVIDRGQGAEVLVFDLSR